MSSLNVVFMGTPDFAAVALRSILETDHNIVAVYSQPPRPKGRGHQVQKSPVHKLAEDHQIPVYTPQSLRKDEGALEQFRALDADIAVVVAYGQILPKAFLQAPQYGCLNIHASLLPRWRGAAPIQHAIWAGDDKSGVAIMQMDEGLDTGPVIAVEECVITKETTAQTLHDTLASMGGRMIVDVLNETAAQGQRSSAPQDHDSPLMTYASMLKKDHGRIDWSQNSDQLDRQFRALIPWPGVWTKSTEGKRLKILQGEIGKSDGSSPFSSVDEGTILNEKGDVICGDDTVFRLIKVQPENAKPMDFKSAVNGGYLSVGGSLK